MNNTTWFVICSLLLVTLLVGQLALGWVVKQRPNLWKTLPRERLIGAIIGFICLAYLYLPVSLMLEGGLEKFRTLVGAMVILLPIAAYFLLDFLFTRAVGGLVVVLASLLLDFGLFIHLPGRPVFSASCYLVAIGGLFMIGKPWIWRDWLETITQKEPLKLVNTCLSLGGLSVFLIYLFLGVF